MVQSTTENTATVFNFIDGNEGARIFLFHKNISSIRDNFKKCIFVKKFVKKYFPTNLPFHNKIKCKTILFYRFFVSFTPIYPAC